MKLLIKTMVFFLLTCSLMGQEKALTEQENAFEYKPGMKLEFKQGMKEQDVSKLEALLDELYLHYSWCVWHEGMRVYDDALPGSLVDPNKLRTDCSTLQSHNPNAQGMIKAATNNQIVAMSITISGDVFGVYQLQAHFRWCAYHENHRDEFLSQLQQGRYADIRRTYFNCQSHNPNARNLLGGVSNATIKAIVNGL